MFSYLIIIKFSSRVDLKQTPNLIFKLVLTQCEAYIIKTIACSIGILVTLLVDHNLSKISL